MSGELDSDYSRHPICWGLCKYHHQSLLFSVIEAAKSLGPAFWGLPHVQPVIANDDAGQILSGLSPNGTFC